MKNSNENSIIYGLRASYKMAQEVAKELDLPYGKIINKKFADGEIFLQNNDSVRGKKVFVIQSIVKTENETVNDNLMELLIFLDSLKRASAKEIIVLIPYFGYARQDRKNNARQSISARLVADMLEKAGATKVMTFDIHSEQIQGFFNIPVDLLNTTNIYIQAIKKLKLKNLAIVSPDYGGIKRARNIAFPLKLDMSIIDKKRMKFNEVEVEHLLGSVKNRNCLIIDDLIDTAGTMVEGIKLLKKKGAMDIYILATHPILSDKDGTTAISKLKDVGVKKLITTNSVYKEYSKEDENFVLVINLKHLLKEAITCESKLEAISENKLLKWN